MQQPPLIRYNLKERGRKYRGRERNFNIKAMVESINGPATQERVQTRAMLGYFGHWPRVRFGMDPMEGGIADGKAHALEPALVTVSIKAYEDGTIEHQTNFLDTDTGKLASRMFANRVGGFSSAIDSRNNELYGFDYVNEPNYSTNRGYDLVLDSVTSGAMTLEDVIAEEHAEQMQAMNRLFDMMQASVDLALDSASRFERENAELMSMLEKREEQVRHAVLANSSGANMAQQLLADRQNFLDSALPVVKSPKGERSRQQDAEYSRLLGRMVRHV